MTEEWLITRLYWETRRNSQETFIAMINGDTASETMLEMTERLYHALCNNNPQYSQNLYAQHRYFSDGTPNRDTISCGYNPIIYTRRIYNISITPQEQSGYLLRWREPHIPQADGIIEYWEEFNLPMRVSTGPPLG